MSRPVLTIAASDNSRVLGSDLSSELATLTAKARIVAFLADRKAPASARFGLACKVLPCRVDIG
jgi:hypothetical protein